MNLRARDQRVIWHPYTHSSLELGPIPIVRGEGAYLIGEDGRHYLDAISSWWVNLHGHGNGDIARAISDQAHRLEHSIFAGFTHEPAVELAECLLTILPKNQSRIFFSDNGSTAVEVALKLAIQYHALTSHPAPPSRRKVITLDGGYHGDTFGTMSVSAKDTFTRPFEGYLFETVSIPAPTGEDFPKLLSRFEALCKESDTLAFIYEPLIQGAGGMVMYGSRELNQLLQCAQQYGVLTIADEVMTGFGRTGTHFASLQLERSPDMLCLSKGITGGFLPLGATSVAGHIFEAFQGQGRSTFFYHGHSYTGNPLSCAAGVTSFRLLTTPECQESIARISALQKNAANELSGAPGLKNVRVMGTVLAADISTDGETHYTSSIRDSLYAFFLEQGLLLRPLGNVVYILPPYCIENSDLERCYDALREAGAKFGSA